MITYLQNNHMRSYELKSHLRPGISFAILSLSKFYVAPRLNKRRMGIPWYPLFP